MLNSCLELLDAHYNVTHLAIYSLAGLGDLVKPSVVRF